MWTMLSNNTTTTPIDAMGYDAISTFTINDGLGINALPDSEYKRGYQRKHNG